jgi:hypothetical protein
MEFFEPGIYYYSDHNFEEAAEYIGTVIVKPKQMEHFVELTTEGFNPGKTQLNSLPDCVSHVVSFRPCLRQGG